MIISNQNTQCTNTLSFLHNSSIILNSATIFVSNIFVGFKSFVFTINNNILLFNIALKKINTILNIKNVKL